MQLAAIDAENMNKLGHKEPSDAAKKVAEYVQGRMWNPGISGAFKHDVAVRVDRETGLPDLLAEVEQLRTQRDALMEAAALGQWACRDSHGAPTCPCCACSIAYGHADSCELRSAIAAAKD